MPKILLAVFVMLLIPGFGFAETFVVTPNGTGDFETVQAAVDAAVDGDIIALGDGTFRGEGNRKIRVAKSIVIRSQSGNREACVFRPGADVAFSLGAEAAPGPRLEGITVSDGQGIVFSGAVECWGNLTLSNCLFLRNAAGIMGGGAVYCSGGSPHFVDCLFQENFASTRGGAVLAEDCSATFERCHFAFNAVYASHGIGAAISISASTAELTDCVFNGNSIFWEEGAGGSGGAIIADQCPLTLRGCTLAGNSTNRGYGGAIAGGPLNLISCTIVSNEAQSGSGISASSLTAENTIIFEGVTGSAIECQSAILRCCDIYGNEGGDWTGNIADLLGVDGNISADPCFCEGELTIDASSPCAGNSCCRLMGAWPVGCDTPINQETWGSIKAVFRER